MNFSDVYHPGLDEIHWNRSLEANLEPGSGVNEAQLPSVKHLSRKPAVSRCETVDGIAQDGMPEMLQVDADLVCSPCVKRAPYKRVSADFLKYLVAGSCRPSHAGRSDGHALPVDGMTADRRVDHAASRAKMSGCESEIDLCNHAPGKLFSEDSVCGIVFGDDETAGSIFVQSMHDSRTLLAADAGKIPAVMEKRINQRSPLIADGRMHHHSRLFVHNQQIFILEKNVKRYLFRQRFRGPKWRDFDCDGIAGTQLA
jgi:hypothetical protein